MMRPMLVAGLVTMGALVAAPGAPAGTSVNTYELSVYGMVCNQCAYGVEQAVQHTAGVQDTTVDLRDGIVRVTPQAGTLPDPQAIADRITNQRVSIARFRATLTGRIERGDDGWRLLVGDRHFNLGAGEGVDLATAEGRTVTVHGLFSDVTGVDGTQKTPDRVGPDEALRFVVEEVRSG